MSRNGREVMMMMDSPEAKSEQLRMLGLQRTLRNHRSLDGGDGVGEIAARFQILGLRTSILACDGTGLGIQGDRAIGRGQFSVNMNFTQGTPN